MHRTLKLSVMLALALGSTQVAAMQFGQVQVKSALGEPLLAEIPLHPDNAAEMRDLSVRLAPPEDFERAGLSVSRPSVSLEFNMVGSGQHRVIRITSKDPVNDPYLDLLVEVDSAAGRSLREFPILLDPPGMQQASSGPARTPASRPAVPAAASSTAAATPAASRSGASDRYGPVKPGQTLSAIARETAPAGIDANQMLLALKQANPNAFYKDNINALKSGAVLRIPDAAQARALSAAAAAAEVRRQQQAWRNPQSSPTLLANAATGQGTGASPTAGAGGDRLAIVPPGQGGSSAGSAGRGKGNDAALRQDLMRAQESLSTLQQQSSDLKSRVKDLQDINDKNQRLLALKDNEIAELQQKLAAARKAGAVPAAASTVAATPATPAAASSAKGTTAAAVPAAAGSSGAATAGTAAAAANKAVPATAKPPARPLHKPAVKPAPVHPVEEAQPWFMQPWAWAAAGGAVIVLLALLALGRRRKPVATRSEPGGSLADRFGSLAMEHPTSGDPEQDELLDQLAEHPDDIGLHLELVSLYYGRRDIEHFEAAAEAMHAHISDPEQSEWLDVLEMGRDLDPNHPLFSDGEVLPYTEDEGDGDGEAGMLDFGDEDGHEEPAEHDGFALDDHAERSEEGTISRGATKVSEYHFDFDLTPRARQAREAAAAQAAMHETGNLDEDAALSTDLAAEPLAFDLGEEASAEPAHEADAAEETRWNFENIEVEGDLGEQADNAQSGPPASFSDDPIDTKLDLARAYMDMGDADGARGMLEEVLLEGSQMQKDTAQRLLDSMA